VGNSAAEVLCDLSRKVDWTWRVDYMAPSVAGSYSDEIVPLGRSEVVRLYSLS
jgi:hypothetical protein